MNNYKIAFIICTNNDVYYEECTRYISELKIPEGYETDVICIREADYRDIMRVWKRRMQDIKYIFIRTPL